MWIQTARILNFTGRRDLTNWRWDLPIKNCGSCMFKYYNWRFFNDTHGGFIHENWGFNWGLALMLWYGLSTCQFFPENPNQQLIWSCIKLWWLLRFAMFDAHTQCNATINRPCLGVALVVFPSVGGMKSMYSQEPIIRIEHNKLTAASVEWRLVQLSQNIPNWG